METGKTLRGTIRLASDSVEGITHLVEGMYRNITATPLPFGKAPEGPAPGIAGQVHDIVRKVNRGVSGTTELLLKPVSKYIDRIYPPGPYRGAAIAALNGVCGDHLAHSNNTLAIQMKLRVFLAPDVATSAEKNGDVIQKKVPLGHLFETRRRAVEFFPRPNALSDQAFTASGKILILAHGLCMDDKGWTSHQHNHGHMLAEEHGYTPVFAHYNSGRHISENGRDFAEAINGLVESWPVAVESISIVGFSMGGLLTRSALHLAATEKAAWLERVDKVVYVGTPHHGSALERGGYWLQKAASVSPYTAPLGALGKIRSAGITDLRHGNILDSDWNEHDEHEDNADHRQYAPLIDGIEHFAIGATLSKEATDSIWQLRSDGLVHPTSSHGVHVSRGRELAFPEENTRLFYDLGHLAMLHDQRVAEQLNTWLAQ